MSKYALHDYSFWGHSPEVTQKTLTGDVRCEVAIIGGGYTGMSAALALTKRGRETVLLEADFCGSGASGRNAGYLSQTIGGGYLICRHTFGKERGLALQKMAEESVHFSEELISSLEIDCDYEATGNFIAAVHPSQEPQIRYNAIKAQEAGLGISYADEKQTRELGLPDAFLSGAREHLGGMLNPAKLALGLRNTLLNTGVRVFEKSPVVSLDEQASRVSVHTASGKVTADKVILGTNAYTPSRLKLLQRMLVPMRVYQFATRVLAEDELELLGWRSRLPVVTGHGSLENFRLSPDNRIVGGSKWVKYAYGGGLAPLDDPQVFSDFAGLVQARFRSIRNLSIEHFWGGWTCMTRDFVPLCGSLGTHGRICYSLGYNGHGLANGLLLGHEIARHSIGEHSEHVALLDRNLPSLPPEPVRWLGVNYMQRKMMRKDPGVDRELAAGA